jgi:hypothetical protein
MIISKMLLTVLIGSGFAVVVTGLGAGAVAIRNRQHALRAKGDAAQLQRRADHLFKIALAAQVHTRNDDIARALLDEAVRILEHSIQLDPNAESTANSLRECRELIANIDSDPMPTVPGAGDPIFEFPETELIEAQLHLTEATRLLIGRERRGQIGYDALAEMLTAIKQAQRAIDLRLQLHKAEHSLAGDRNTPKFDEGQAREYLAAMERNRAQSSR